MLSQQASMPRLRCHESDCALQRCERRSLIRRHSLYEERLVTGDEPVEGMDEQLQCGLIITSRHVPNSLKYCAEARIRVASLSYARPLLSPLGSHFEEGGNTPLIGG